MGRCGTACGGTTPTACTSGMNTTCANLMTDVANCGACGTACAAGQLCVVGACTGGMTCPTPQTNCHGSCANPNTDDANCGQCGHVCNAASRERCVSGHCEVVCGAGQTICDGRCVNTNTDNSYCGMCGRACMTGQVCSMGVCTATCGASATNCMGDCVNTDTDTANCGMCANLCALANVSEHACRAGRCVVSACRVNFSNCDMAVANGCETNTRTDNANCGMCGRACMAGQVCSMGMCTASCGAGTTTCSGSCVNINTDTANCGMCGMACRFANASATCAMGVCAIGACTTGFANCDGIAANGCELNVRGTDTNNCGACGSMCSFANAAASCAMGTCALGACARGFGNCDMNPANGCEANTVTDNANCGTCGRACVAGQVCSMGVCTASCGASTTNCSGSCVNTNTDTANCGICGMACRLANASATCAMGVCAIGACTTGFGDCDMNPANGCETNLRGTDASHCGSCTTVCSAPLGGSAACAAGVCSGSCPSAQLNCGGMCLPSGSCTSAGSGGCEVVGLLMCSGMSTVCSMGPRISGSCASPTGGTCGLTGVCACGVGLALCVGSCVDTMTNLAHCGGCTRPCAMGQTCSAGVCMGGPTGCYTTMSCGLAYAPGTDTDLQGNFAGGTLFPDDCPTGQVMVGYNAYLGASFDGIQIVCGLPTIVWSGGTATVRVDPGASLMVRGSTSNPPGSGRCPPNQVVVGFGGRAGSLVDQIILRCAPLLVTPSGSGGAVVTVGSITSTPPVGGPGGDPIDPNADCVGVARGANIRGGGSIDALGLRCATPSAIPSAP